MRWWILHLLHALTWPAVALPVALSVAWAILRMPWHRLESIAVDSKSLKELAVGGALNFGPAEPKP